MGDAASACPSDETLTRLARGELGASEARRLDEHVRGCASCRRVLQAIAGVLVTQLQATLTTPVARAPSQPVAAPLATPVIDHDQHVFTAPADRFVSPEGLVELGRGGLGRVLQVLDRGLEREVAVKEILEVPEAARPAVERRFIREARLAAQLEHPGIVPVYDLGRGPDGRLFYAMRRIEGTTLAERIDSMKGLTERLTLLPNVLTICQAVAFAHSRGVVHRDIKPQNVMIGAFGETLLLDWGLARSQGEAEQRPEGVDSDDARMTRAGKAVGTPAYLSPEQAKGELEAIDEKSDQWALGALLYQLVTGHPPYADLTVEAVITKAVLGLVPPVEVVVPQVPRELAAIIARALAPAKADRYEDVRALAKDLTAYLDGRRVAAYDYSPLERLRRLVSRYRVATAVVGTALVVLLGGGTASYRHVKAERDEYRRLSAVVVTKGLSALRHIPGNRELVTEIATTVQESFSRVGTQLDAPVEDRARLVSASASVAAMQYETGHYPESIASRRVSALIADSVAQERPTAESMAIAASEHSFLALALFHGAGSPESHAEIDRAQALLEEARRRWPGDEEVLKAETLIDSAALDVGLEHGDYLAMLPLAQRAVEAERQLCALKKSTTAMDLYNQVIGLTQLADLDRMVGRFDDGRAAVEEALGIVRQLEEAYPGTNDYLEASYEAHMNAATLARDQGRAEEAASHLAIAHKAAETVAAIEPTNLRYHQVMLRTGLEAGNLTEVKAALSALAALPGFDDDANDYVIALLFAEAPEEILRALAAHPKLAEGTPGRVVAACAAVLAHRPAEALRWLDAELAAPGLMDEWQPGQLVARLASERGPEIEAARRYALEVDATEAPRDEARRAKALRRFADDLRAIVGDAGAR